MKKTFQAHNKVSFLDKAGYGSGNFSTGVINQVVGTYLVFYCTAILGIPGYLIGLAVSLSIVWDAVTDPIMGYLSDITKSEKFGRRHLYVLIGGVGMALCNYLLWNIHSDFTVQVKFIIIFILLLLIKTFSTIYVTPYTALGAELSSDYNERTSIQGIKTIFFLLGLAFVSVFGMYVFFKPTLAFPSGQLNPSSYSMMGLFSSIIIVIFALVCFFTTKKYIPILNEKVQDDTGIAKLSHILSDFKAIFMNRSFRYVAFAYMFTNVASALIANMGLHVFTYTFLLTSQQIAAIIGIQFAVSILSQPAWFYISERLDKKPSVILGILISIFSSLGFMFMVLVNNQISGNILYFIPFAVLAGFGTAALFTLPLSMIADIIDIDEVQTGKRTEGSYYGFLTMFYKMSQSVTLLLIGFVLDLVNFDPNLAIQSESTVVILGLFLSIGSTFSFVAGYFMIRKYDINKSLVELAQKQLASTNDGSLIK
ncbi:MAG: MFS transporter [Eubacteriaceae bacterium]|nr:MFS transporter [Eubacteriaceae bacterium]